MIVHERVKQIGHNTNCGEAIKDGHVYGETLGGCEFLVIVLTLSGVGTPEDEGGGNDVGKAGDYSTDIYDGRALRAANRAKGVNQRIDRQRRILHAYV